MSKSRTTRIDGLDKLTKDLEKFAKEAVPPLGRVAHHGAESIRIRAKAKVNNVSGDLARSLRVKDSKLSSNKLYVGSYVTWGDDVRDYAAPLELGHNVKNVKDGPVIGHVKARPFLRPAADESKRNIKKWMIEAINKQIEKLGVDI